MTSYIDKKISIIHSFMDWHGGAEKLIASFAIRLSQSGFPIELIAGKISESWKKEIQKSSNRISLKEFGKQSRGPSFWLFAQKYANQMESLIDRKSKLLFPQSYPATLAAVKFKKKFHIPCIWYCHDPTRILHEDISKSYPFHHELFINAVRKMHKNSDITAVRDIDVIIANSKYTAKNIEKIYNFSEKKIRIIYPGIAFSENKKIRKVPALIKKMKSKNTKIIFCPSALDFRKNFINILEALNKLQNTQIKAIFPGGRNEEIKKYRHEIKRLKIEEKTMHIEKLSNEDLQAYYISSDLVLYIPINEPFGLVALESLSCKTPVVVSNQGGIAEIVEDGVTGLKVDPKNPRLIASAIDSILSDNEKAMRMGEMGNKAVQKKFSIEKSVNQLIEIFNKTI